MAQSAVETRDGRGDAALTILAVATCAGTGLAGSLAAGLGWTDAAFVCNALTCLLLLAVGTRLVGGYNNLLCVFLFFHLIYGMSGPFAALYGEPLAPIFSVPYETDRYLVNLGLASVGLVLGMCVGLVTSGRTADETARIPMSSSQLAMGAVLFAATASGMELLNLARVGIGSLVQGKAVYQSDTDALLLTMPSYEVAKIGVALLALWLASRRADRDADAHADRGRRWGLLIFVAFLPLLAISLFLGRRGPLLDAFFVVAVGRTYALSLRRLRPKLVMSLLAVYFVMGMIFVNRAIIAYAAYSGDASDLVTRAFEPERIATALNPAATEFGSAFGNFSEYAKYDVAGPQYGRTYLESVALLIPGFMYPAIKPQPVAFAFRDRFFPSEAEMGAIGSTAYSSLLETYVNFREAGAFLIYLVLGFALVRLERRRFKRPSLFFVLAYLGSLPAAIVFHRSDFGAGALSPVVYAVVLAGVAAVTLRVIAYATQPVIPGTRPFARPW
ncbi:MAG TPA: O-antigen polymerase [Gemmatimonadaceae bacterium]|nr:O-antigen polymerase [Gemmatimonadaceae bacterium]